jgi:hypothetical protein
MKAAIAFTLLSLAPAFTMGMEAGKPQAKPADKWINLFDGKSLKGWMILSGFAKYHVEDGVIVGTAQEFSGNTFLCTDKSYADFILEFEVKDDPELNSGVQFRSHVYSSETIVTGEKDGKKFKRTWPAGRVYGYQVEIADVAGNPNTSGGIYDEARKGVWLYDVSKDPVASKAFKAKEWNKYRVECRGSSIKTWINDVPCAKLVDTMDASGFIGLQVHGIRGNRPLQVRFRNLRLQELSAKK